MTMLDFEDLPQMQRVVGRRRAGISRAQQLEMLRHRRMADRMARHYAVHHTHPMPGGLGVLRARPVPGQLSGVRLQTRGPQRRHRMTDIPIEGWEADNGDAELGIFPLLGMIPSIIGGISSMFGGGGKEAAPAPPPAAPAAAPIPGGGMAMQSGPDPLSADAMEGIVRKVAQTVSPPVRQQVDDAVSQQFTKIKAGNADIGTLLGNIVKQLGPQMGKQLQVVNDAANQRQATFEHGRLKRADNRWENNAKAQNAILKRLNDMEGRLGTMMVQKAAANQRIASAFGLPRKLMG